MLTQVIEKLKKFRFTVPSLVLASSSVKTTALTNVPTIALGFCALVMVLTFSMIFAGYAERKAE